MKKLLALALALLMALAMTVPALAAEDAETHNVGSLARLGMDAEEMQEGLAEHRSQRDPGGAYHDVYYNSLTEMLMALEAGFIELAGADEPTVQYILSQTDAYVEVHPEVDVSFEYSMCFPEEGAELCDSFSEAIQAMKEDGTLDELATEYIDGVIAGEEPEAVAFPSFDGADTVTVAVTGDLPPMDYVDDAGQGAGFNTAVLAEIAQRLEINIELFQVDSSARALALASGRADAIFWVHSDVGSNAIQSMDIPEGTVISEPYYTAQLCSLALADAE